MPILSILARPVPDVATPPLLGAGNTVTLPGGRRVGYANFDYAASAPSLVAVADAVTELLPWHASVHRGAGAASRRCTLAFDRARETVAEFVGARPGDHVIFTRNTTDALNLLARALPAGTTVIGWLGEHHANLLPWPATVRLPVPASVDDALCDLAAALGRVTGPALVAVTGASNVTGEVWPVETITALAHSYGARVVVDAAQLVPHRPVSLAAWGVDYLAFSGHKAYAPFGAGVLAGRADWLDAAAPYLAGGGATAAVDDESGARWQLGPARHEAGTPNLLGAVALAAACATLDAADRTALAARERALLDRLRDGLADVDGVTELRIFRLDHDRVGIVSFTVAGRDAADVSAALADGYGIGVRDGLFCAHPLTRYLLAGAEARSGRPAGQSAVRASIGLGTTVEHVDRLIGALKAITRP